MRSVVISECDIFKKSNVVQSKLHNFVVKNSLENTAKKRPMAKIQNY